MTEDELRTLAAVHPIAWAMYASEGAWQRAKHLQHLGERLMALARGDIKRLCVSFPPRHGKSELISKFFSTWWLGHFPEDRVVLASYGERLTTQWSRAARDLYASHASDVWGTTTNKRASITDWHVFSGGKRTGGGMFAVGKGGGLTGRGADLLVCDDLLRDAQEANNHNLLETTWDWFRSVALTRLSPKGRAVMIATRWHHEDPIGRIIAQQEAGDGGEPWEILNLPAVALEGDPLGREPGTALWPERFSRKHLDKIRKDVGPYVWEALYQGNPTPAEGGLFKRDWLRTVELKGSVIVYPDGKRVDLSDLVVYGVADLAASTKEYADYSVLGIMGADLRNGRIVTLDLHRGRYQAPEILGLMRRCTESWGLASIYVERTAYNLQLVEVAASEGLPVREIHADRDKVSRALPTQAALESGSVFVVARSPWLPAFTSELLSFPHGANDDQVDVLSYGVSVFRGLQAGSAPKRAGIINRGRRNKDGRSWLATRR